MCVYACCLSTSTSHLYHRLDESRSSWSSIFKWMCDLMKMRFSKWVTFVLAASWCAPKRDKILIFPLPANVPSKLKDRFLRKCLMTQKSASSFGPAGSATARWQGGESKICLSTLSGSSLAARGCKKSCRRLRFAWIISPRVVTCACSLSYEQIVWFSKKPVH